MATSLLRSPRVLLVLEDVLLPLKRPDMMWCGVVAAAVG